jgi:hypothetical protein
VTGLDEGLAAAFAEVAASNIQKEYPHKLDHVLEHAGDVRSPRELHPVFYGSYDWHSSVHMHWLLVRLVSRFRNAAFLADSCALLDAQFSKDKVGVECAYLKRPSACSFERTYGWAWLLALQGELSVLARTTPMARTWADNLAPLAERFVTLYLEFLPVADFAIRTGTHQNSAFGLLLSHIAALQMEHSTLAAALAHKARSWFSADRDYPAHLEPSGSDFLSAGLVEAALMQQVLGADFSDWWQQFRPKADAGSVWRAPVAVSDRSDAQLSHLDGLNLSRAWCIRRLAADLPKDEARAYLLAAQRMLEAAMPHTRAGHFVGTHWLASFAALALGQPGPGL